MTDATVDWANYKPPPDSVRCRAILPVERDPHWPESAAARARFRAETGHTARTWADLSLAIGTMLYPPRCLFVAGHPGPHESWQHTWGPT